MTPPRAFRLSLLAAALSGAASAHASGVSFAPTANVQYDAARIGSDHATDATEDGFRRARVGFKLKDAGKRWQLVVEHDLADRTPPDAYLEITPGASDSFRIGQFKQPFLLEDAISDKQSALLEPSTLGAFAISRRIGAAYGHYGARGTVDAAVFGQRLDGTNESLGASVRGTRRVPTGGHGTAHVGMSLASERPDDAFSSFSAGAGSVLTPLRLASTGRVRDTQRVDRAALEAVWVSGAWSAQAERAQVALQRDGRNAHGRASAVQLTFSPTGNGRVYKRGVPGAPAPTDAPAWEFALRWSAIDLDDGAMTGGTARQLGLGATCYVGEHLRIGANLLRGQSQRRGVTDHPTVAALRVQLTY